jgi:hypothetical protein
MRTTSLACECSVVEDDTKEIGINEMGQLNSKQKKNYQPSTQVPVMFRSHFHPRPQLWLGPDMDYGYLPSRMNISPLDTVTC